MAEKMTLARPYAKAAFQHALETNQINDWSIMLNTIAVMVSDEQVKKLISNPTLSSDKRASFFTSQTTLFDKDFCNFILLVAENNRLALLPEMASGYEKIKNHHNQEADVTVVSAMNLDDSQKEQIEKAVHKKVQKNIRLKYGIEPELIGGLVIKIGDVVIDGSVKGQLKKLVQTLVN